MKTAITWLAWTSMSLIAAVPMPLFFMVYLHQQISTLMETRGLQRCRAG